MVYQQSTIFEDKEPPKDELKMAINVFKNNKTSGENDLAAMLIKNCGEEFINKLTREMWHKEEVLKEWRTAIICPVYKERDIMNCHSYRMISLLSIKYRILSSILLNRTKSYSKDTIGNYECGFMSGK